MVQLVLYGNEKAMCTQKVLILLETLNLKYTFRNIDLQKGEQKSPEYLKLQPFGKVPAIQYGDDTIFESRAILRYIAANNQEIDDLLGDVNVDVWLEAESQNFCPPISKIILAKLYGKGDTSENAISEALKEVEKVLDVYETRLAQHEYIGGDNFSIADISHIPYVNGFLKAGYKSVLKSRPNVYNWLKRIMRRDAVKQVLQK
ncbi:hypothetical protein EB118_06045 [bacterium]|nr:hypothetical protein [bacterium]NDC93774.1 hypothetical protein [bacterium]NDD83107.1 hypothetical protein [bacterium]NDG29640.1 hypothetical protein [bacterium]